MNVEERLDLLPLFLQTDEKILGEISIELSDEFHVKISCEPGLVL